MSNWKAKASCRRPNNIKKCKNMKNVKNENRHKLIILEGFRQNGLQIRIQRNFLRISTPVKIIFRHLFEHVIFDIRIVKNCMFLMFWRLGTMLEWFFIGKSFRLHISKPKKIPGNIFVDISKVKKCHKLRIQGRMQIFEKKCQSALNHVLIG